MTAPPSEAHIAWMAVMHGMTILSLSRREL
jgi:hypothetical protein